MKRILLFRLLAIFPILGLFYFVYKITIPRIGAFGCFDDCFNIGAGYFLTKGKILYSQIFFNHQPFAAYISFGIQQITHPGTLYELIRQHRQFMILWALIWELFFVLRFGLQTIPFAFVYELTKPYVFGERFLAEGMLVYPLVYIFAVVSKQMRKLPIYLLDFIFVSISGWFILWIREPFIPVVCILYSIFIFPQLKTKRGLLSLGILIVLCIFSLISLPISAYWYQVIGVNKQIHGTGDILTIRGFFSILFYPILLYIGGVWNPFRYIELVMMSGLWFGIVVWVRQKKTWQYIFFILCVLTVSNLRFTAPGRIYYEAFHMAGWWALMLWIAFELLLEISENIKIRFMLTTIFFAMVLSPLLNHSSYLFEKVDRQEEFTTNYSQDFVYGEVVRLLAMPSDTVFADGSTDLIYWQSKVPSLYAYSWYTSYMPKFAPFVDSRTKLFQTHPPTFYISFCSSNTVGNTIPLMQKDLYTSVFFSDQPSCLFVLKTKISQITADQKQKIAVYNFSIQDMK